MCEEMFDGEIDVADKAPDLFKSEKSQVKQYQDWLHERNGRELDILKTMEVVLENIDSFSRTKKSMHFPIRYGIQEALKGLNALRRDMEETD